MNRTDWKNLAVSTWVNHQTMVLVGATFLIGFVLGAFGCSGK